MGRAHYPRNPFLRTDRRMPWEGRKSMRMGRCEGVNIPRMGHSRVGGQIGVTDGKNMPFMNRFSSGFALAQWFFQKTN